MGTSKKITAIVLAVISVIFIVGAGFLIYQLQLNQAPDDADAAGFGDTAVKDYFKTVDGFFKSVPCSLILNNGLVISYSNGYGKPLLDFGLTTISDIPSEGRLQRICEFTEENMEGKKYTIANPLKTFFELEVSTYDQQSYIYESEKEKTDFLNSNFLGEILDKGEFPEDKTKYFFGTSLTVPGMCIGLIYHDSNEFEYAKLTYYGYDCKSEEAKYKNKVYSKAISNFTNKNITNIYGAAGFNPYDTVQ